MEELVFYSMNELKEYLKTVPDDQFVKVTVCGGIGSENAIFDETRDGIKEEPGGDSL